MSDSSNDEDPIIKELQNEMEGNLEQELHPKCCIYRVPKYIREINPKVYTPQLISIGPLHYNKVESPNMNNQKKRYMKSYLKQRITSIEKGKQLLAFIKNNEQTIRNCYAEIFELSSIDFVKMILYDAIFIIELFIRYACHRDYSRDLLLVIPAVKYALYLDLQLLENQLPYFVLEELYTLTFADYGSNFLPFVELSFSFMASYDKIFRKSLPTQVVFKHFTDWKRCALLTNYPRLELCGRIKDLPSAVKLHESGVKFKHSKGECSIFDIKFEKGKQRIPCFKVNELQIPCLEVYDETECLFRNMMALEQCHYPNDTRICNYIFLMDTLINTEKDVDLLVKEKIISNHLGDNASVVNMFNKLCLGIHLSASSYNTICEELKAHYNSRWNNRMATLKGVYFSNPWRGTATVAAIILLVLTITQTVFSILQVFLN